MKLSVLSSAFVSPLVRARKSPWIETENASDYQPDSKVRARKSPWIETVSHASLVYSVQSGLVRARGLKQDLASGALNCHCQGS